MSEKPTYAPHLIQLPAVLQVAGQAPFFGTIASMSEQGLSFDFQTEAPTLHAVGSKAILYLEFNGHHHSSNCLLVHVHGTRALLSLREAPPALLAALHSVDRHNAPNLAASLSVLQRQHACHLRFMDGMKAVVDEFYLLLPGEIEQRGEQAASLIERSALSGLQARLTELRPVLTRQLTQSFPMYPEQRTAYAKGTKADPSLGLVDMAEVDDWIRRTTIAQKVFDAITPLPHEFNRRYNALFKSDQAQTAHPYLPDSILNHFGNLLAPLEFSADQRVLCYELMGQALQQEAGALYSSMMQALGESPSETRRPGSETSLANWLKASVQEAGADEGNGITASAAQVSDLAALLERLTHNLDELGHLPLDPALRPAHDAGARIPGLLARDRIVDRFLPARPAHTPEGAPQQLDLEWTAATRLGGLADLDRLALEGLRTQLRQPPPIEPGPERLSQASQIRDLMLQAQGLVMEYTLNGLTYQAQPDHPAWTLVNALDALHRGADDQGRFLEPEVFRATSLAMQWLLGQQNPDSALEQINALLARVNEQFLADQQSRREGYLDTLGEAAPTESNPGSGWCVVKREGEAIPYEILGRFDDRYALLNRSATELLEIPAARFMEDADSGQIETAASFDRPFLERTADVALAASLNAVHTFTWKDPASGCLKRSALMDELERRLDHPVLDPPTYCALVEIPTMRPSLSPLPGDELTVMQTRSGELLLEMLEHGEQCGRLSDVSFMLVFAPQDPGRVVDRLSRLKADMEGLHPSWKMIGAVVPLVVSGETAPTPSTVLRRANEACARMRGLNEFDLSCLLNPSPAIHPVGPLPFASLYLRCQKIESCDQGAPSHYEILLGVNDALTPAYSTQGFVLMAEQTGRIHELDAWVLQSVFEWMDRNASALDQMSGLSVNLSGTCLTRKTHVDEMVRQFSVRPHLAKKLILEVTETAAIDNLDVAVRSLRKLRKLGCRIALDDFGSGYSSYTYIRSLPLDYLKIDGTYIRNILTDKTDQALTASMVDVAHALGLKVIAEYVDSEATYAWLKALGVDYVQGYWVHEPERLDTLVLN